MAEHYDFGKEAEQLAVQFLEKKKYKILERNYRFQKAEIDIIAHDLVKNEIVIVEVKARKYNSLQKPEEAVTKSKQKLLLKATDAFLINRNLNLETRFDIISIEKSVSNWTIRHIENAFYSFE
ncbi:MAG: YraN family protein [Moheibacter sp.]